jgi:hypothetical protein
MQIIPSEKNQPLAVGPFVLLGSVSSYVPRHMAGRLMSRYVYKDPAKSPVSIPRRLDLTTTRRMCSESFDRIWMHRSSSGSRKLSMISFDP